MANRSFLIQSSTSVPIVGNSESADVLAAANYCIPVYWYSLFDRSCVVSNEVKLHDGRVEAYPYLVTSLVDARRRSSERRSSLLRISPEPHSRLIEQWLRFLDGIAQPFVHLEMAEICMMADGFHEHLVSCLGAFDSPMPESLSTHEAWSEMLDAAQIDPDDLVGTLASYKIAGYSWNRPVTWE